MIKEMSELSPADPFVAHKWWFAATKAVGVPETADALDLSSVTIYRYRADGITSARSTSVLERLHYYLQLLCDFDRKDLAASAVEFLHSAIGDSVAICPKELAPTMTEEQLLDFETLSRLHRAMKAGVTIDEIHLLQNQHEAEVARTVAKHIEGRRTR